jgi:hypothetical protein
MPSYVKDSKQGYNIHKASSVTPDDRIMANKIGLQLNKLCYDTEIGYNNFLPKPFKFNEHDHPLKLLDTKQPLQYTNIK